MAGSNGDGNGNALAPGQIQFFDNCVPTLEVGDYLINMTQQVTSTKGSINDAYAASQAFSVQGPRYVLPPSDLFSVFPPNDSQGIFEQFLPHVVLTRRELPWERNIFADPDTVPQTPWLALLLFVEDEQIDGQPTLLAPLVQGWQANQNLSAVIPATSFYNLSSGTLSAKTQPDAQGILWPDLNPEWYETTDYLTSTMSVIIDLSPQAFAALIPLKADLPYLAHARQVDPSAKDGEVLSVSGDGWYSVLVGNRLPDAPPAGTTQPGRRNILHLVSLEGFEEFINGSQTLPTAATRVRMISLRNWSFTCLPEGGESFSELMNGLLTDPLGNAKSTSFLLPAASPPDQSTATQYASQAIQNGYVPLRYQTRLGEQTFCWFRGPFSPLPVADFVTALEQPTTDPSGWQPFDSASAALIYDVTYGVFDVSYAVAFETGRLLALANGYFGQQLLGWQREGQQLIGLILERSSQIPALQGFNPIDPNSSGLTPPNEAALLNGIQNYAVTDAFMTYLVTQFAGQMAPQPAGQPAAPPDPTFPAYPAMPSPPPNPTTIQELLEETAVQTVVRQLGGQGLDSIADWLAQLYLLVNVPFENLVPHEDLLPPETVRFFYLDPNWLTAIVEGALSIGIESSQDVFYQDLMKDLIWNTTLAAVQKIRADLLPSPPPPGSTPGPMTGMLLRSAVVTCWPGLSVNAYAVATGTDPVDPDPSSLIQLLRMDRLSDDVLLCLWPTLPAVVTIDEPHEGLAFGFEDPPPSQRVEGYYLYLRSLDPTSYGVTIANGPTINAQTAIIGANNILAITATGGLIDAIQNALPGSPTVHIRDFAVEMIKVPERAVFAALPPNQGEE